MRKRNNIAFIDGQNFHLGISENNWKIDYKKFRVYLKDKYRVRRAYYFLGFYDKKYLELYKNLRRTGFVLRFKEHNLHSITIKKGNVDTDIVFEVMRNLIEEKDFSRVLIVSGDGDYKRLVDYLIHKSKFEKILFPNRKFASSLYSRLEPDFYDYLDYKNLKKKLEYKK